MKKKVKDLLKGQAAGEAIVVVTGESYMVVRPSHGGRALLKVKELLAQTLRKKKRSQVP